MFTFTENEVKRNYKTKEYAVLEFIVNTFPNMDWINDKTIEGGCSNYRPDFIADMGTHVIIVEVDEYKHSSYIEKCEEKRLNDLYQDNMRNMAYIRFNPDKYEENGKKISSCWKVNKQGTMTIIKKKE